MTFGEKLKAARMQAGLKQTELAKQLGTTGNTVSNWENNVSKPDLDMLSYICGVLHVTASYFLQATLPEDGVSIPELNMVKKYRSLDSIGKEHVNNVLDWETQRVDALKKALEEKPQHPTQLIELEQTAHPRYTIPYYQRLASAGSGEYLFDNIPTETIEVPANSLSEKADFAIGVNGNSMEPTYCDGDKVYVRLADEIPMGRIGIFIRGSECFIKELGADRLISHNADKALYPDIPAREEGIKLIGEVLGKVEED